MRVIWGEVQRTLENVVPEDLEYGFPIATHSPQGLKGQEGQEVPQLQ